METITDRLTFLMKSKKIKGIDLATATEISTATISRILKGTQIPTVDTLYKFAQYFNVSMEFLLVGKESTFESCANAILSSSEFELVECYRKMSVDDQDELMTIAQMKASKKKRGKEKLNNSSNDDIAFETA